MVGVVERVSFSETLDRMGSAGKEQCRPEELAFGLIALEAVGNLEVVQQPGGN